MPALKDLIANAFIDKGVELAVAIILIVVAFLRSFFLRDVKESLIDAAFVKLFVL